MLRIVALILGCVMSVGVLAEIASDGKADNYEMITVPTQEEYIKENHDKFQKSVQEGKVKEARAEYKKACTKNLGVETYCSCLDQVVAEQTDEFLFYDTWTSFWFYVQMQEAHKAGKAYRYKLLLLQSTQRDSLNRRVALACGVIDDKTKKVVPFKPEAK